MFAYAFADIQAQQICGFGSKPEICGLSKAIHEILAGVELWERWYYINSDGWYKSNTILLEISIEF